MPDYIFFLKIGMKASELAQWVEALVARQDNLSLINLLTQIHIYTQVHLKNVI